MMEVVQLVEVSGPGHEHQVMENFEDLILTVVPEGQDGTTLTAESSDGQQRTIVVHEVRNSQGLEDKTEIDGLKGRVQQLEEQVHFLEDELRIMRRKIVSNPVNSVSAIRRTVLEVLSKQTLKVSVSDFEDEMDSPEPSGRRTSHGLKRPKYENGFSDEDEEEFNSEDDYEPVRRPGRRGPGRPPKGFARKSTTRRVELTPPPPKVNRPRGRPRRTELKREPEEMECANQAMDTTTPNEKDDSVVEAVKTVTEIQYDEESNVAAEIPQEPTDVEAPAESGTTDAALKGKAVKSEADTEETKDDDSKAALEEVKTPLKRGRRRACAEEDPEPSTPTATTSIPAPMRVSTRARKVSRKGSD